MMLLNREDPRPMGSCCAFYHDGGGGGRIPTSCTSTVFSKGAGHYSLVKLILCLWESSGKVLSTLCNVEKYEICQVILGQRIFITSVSLCSSVKDWRISDSCLRS